MISDHSRSRICLFWLLAFIEFFERYGYYIIIALMILLFTNYLGWTETHAYTYTAGIIALIYIAPLAGGWITDRYFDNTFALLFGAITLCLGYILLSLWHFFGINIGMATIIIGMGFFKFSPSAMIGELYYHEPTKLDRLFVIFYVSINAGSMLAFFSAGWLQSYLGWHNIFLIPAVGLIIASGLARIIMHYKQHTTSQFFTYKCWHIILLIIGCFFIFSILQCILHFYNSISIMTSMIAIIMITFITKKSFHLTQREKYNLIYILTMCCIAIIFFILYGEQSTLITLFAEKLCKEKLFGLITIHASAYTGFDAMWILILSPIVSLAFKMYDKTTSKSALMLKFGSGLIISGLGFYVLYIATIHSSAFHSIRPLWVCLSFALQALGEILVSALGLSLMAKWAPKSLYNTLMGGWFLVIALGSCLSGFLNAHLAAIQPGDSFKHITLTYSHTFLLLTMMSIICGITVLLFSRLVCHWLEK